MEYSLPSAFTAFERIVQARRSVRAFLPQTIDDKTIRRVLDATLATPSNCNTQPWLIHMVSGTAIKSWSKALLDAALTGAPPDHDIADAGPYKGAFRARQIDAAVRLFEVQGIARDDQQGRIRSLLRNYALFDAPHAALFCVPDWAGPREIADCGQALQSFLLALTAAGLGSCPQGSLGGYAKTTRDVLRIPENQLILAGVSFGVSDPDHATITVRPPRCALADLVTFHE